MQDCALCALRLSFLAGLVSIFGWQRAVQAEVATEVGGLRGGSRKSSGFSGFCQVSAFELLFAFNPLPGFSAFWPFFFLR